MTYAVIVDSKVSNIISADQYGAKSLTDAGLVLVQTDKPIDIGDTYDGVTFYRDEEEVLTPLEAENKDLVDLLGESVEEEYNKVLEEFEECMTD